MTYELTVYFTFFVMEISFNPLPPCTNTYENLTGFVALPG